MKKNKARIIFVALALILFAGSFAAAQEMKPEDANCPAGMTPEMMAKWAEMATPGDNHKALDGMVGSWTAATKWWAAPGTEPMVSNGTCENSWVLGGRYVMCSYKGDMMGQPFEGLGYLGYDNYKKKYIHLWMDNMGTMWMVSEGTMSGNICTLNSEFDDFLTGKKATMRQEVKVIDNDHHVVDMYSFTPDGKEFKMMEIAYSRKS
jgi:hypothetical protein